MTNRQPSTLTEANTRIVQYYDKLKEDGLSDADAYYMAIEAYKLYSKEHFAPKKDTIVGHCHICDCPITNGEEYTFSCFDQISSSWHNNCALEIGN